MNVVCVHLPRFALATAAGDRTTLLREPAALAPEPGREQRIGEVSLAAEAFGVREGMRLGEALARCPQLALIPPDPMGVADAWERVVGRLESIGAAVESRRVGEAFFAVDGLRGMYGGSSAGVLAAASRALGRRRRIATGPTRFAAYLAATEWGSPVPVEALRSRLEAPAPEVERLLEAQVGMVAQRARRLAVVRRAHHQRQLAEALVERLDPGTERALQGLLQPLQLGRHRGSGVSVRSCSCA